MLCLPEAPVYEEPFERERSLEKAWHLQFNAKSNSMSGRGQCTMNKCGVKRIFTRERNVSRRGGPLDKTPPVQQRQSQEQTENFARAKLWRQASYLLPCIFYGSSSRANSIDNLIRAAAVFVMHTRFLLLKSCSSKHLERPRLLTMFETLHTCNYGERIARDIRNH